MRISDWSSDVCSSDLAYTGDPFDKKARVLAHDLHREGIMMFSDPENLKPAIEYHLIRLYLRSGRVIPASESVRRELIGIQRSPRPRAEERRVGTGGVSKCRSRLPRDH